MAALVIGQKVRSSMQPEWGVGHLLSFEDDGMKALVLFPTRAEPTLVSAKGNSLVPVALEVGFKIRTKKGKTGKITEEVEGGRGLRRYVLVYDDGTDDELPESEVLAQPPAPDLLSMLKEGRVADARAFSLRKNALTLDDERRCDALGALLASRVMVKPHQIGVVQRVLQAQRPRFILADEVGLGKTIESGMIFSALRLAGLARRVLVVVPAHLTVQWLVELFHKFNCLFTLLDGERYEQSLDENPEVSPWARFDLVVTSLEMLQKSAQHRQETAAPEAHWDLVIIDEAHHLKSEKSYLAAEGLAKNSWGLLLLTATPMQLDPAEYQALLSLLDPKTAVSVEDLKSRLARQEALSTAVQALLDAKQPKKAQAALAAIAKDYPSDAVLAGAKSPEEALEHLAETYSLSDALIRNRRAVVGSFSNRRLHRHPVKPPAAESTQRKTAVDAIREQGTLKGAPLSALLRRMESSPAAFRAALANTKDLEGVTLTLKDRDAKFETALGLLRSIWAKEPQAKVLMFTEARETLESLVVLLRDERIEALGYHGDLAMVERDRQVARFRDPDGPKLLICTEVGGEGRNFQFSHHLVHYDLPWSPAAMEQRIGRLDRIGQLHTVEIHVFDVEGSVSSDVLSVFADAVGVFEETIGGLDAVLEEVEPRLTELALKKSDERKAYATELKKKVENAKAQVKRAYDPLLDLKSFDREAVRSLLKRAEARAGFDEDDVDEDATLEDGLLAVSRDLDERLEEAVTELAARIGIGVDTDQEVDAFQCAFHFGHALNVEALPGFDLTKEKTRLGSFWRDTAVEQEEIEYFATGHPLIEALFGFLRDGPFGRNGARYIESKKPGKHRGVEFLFHINPPEPSDTSPGARVPSRQLSRFLERMLIRTAVVLTPNGPKGNADLFPILDGAAGQSLKGDEVHMAFPELRTRIHDLAETATALAQKELAARARAAEAAIKAEVETRKRRLSLSLSHQGLKPAHIETELAAADAFAAAILDALHKATVTLDSACAFVINR